MERRGGPLPAALAFLAAILAGSGKPALAGPNAGPPACPPRTVTIAVLADLSLQKNAVWMVDIRRAVSDVSLTLKEACGISLKITVFGYWPSGPSEQGTGGPPRTVAEALAVVNAQIRSAGHGGAEIVIGLLAEGPDGPVFPGIADYLHGTVVVKYLESKGGIPYVLLHEICHLFGAVDLKTKGSVMSLKGPGFRIDAFTRSILRANRSRSFGEGFPLSDGLIPEAITLYEGRLALGLGEEELLICLKELRRAKARRTSEPR